MFLYFKQTLSLFFFQQELSRWKQRWRQPWNLSGKGCSNPNHFYPIRTCEKSPNLALTQIELGKAQSWLLVANVAAAQNPRKMWRFKALTHTRSRLNSAFPQLPALPWFKASLLHSRDISATISALQAFPQHLPLKDFYFLLHFYLGKKLRCRDALLNVFRTGWSRLYLYISIKTSTKNPHGCVGNSWKCLRIKIRF